MKNYFSKRNDSENELIKNILSRIFNEKKTIEKAVVKWLHNNGLLKMALRCGAIKMALKCGAIKMALKDGAIKMAIFRKTICKVIFLYFFS